MAGGHKTLILILILGIESIVAFLVNGFIIVVNGHRQFQSRKMLPFDLLLTTLGITRFLLQLVGMTMNFLYFFISETLCDIFLGKSFFYVWTYFSSASIWCATWLSVFYCVKVTNSDHCLFLWLKPRINILMPRLLGLSLTVFSLPFAGSALRIDVNCNVRGNVTGNASQDEDSKDYRFGIFISLHFIFIAISVTICLTSSIFLLISLWRHTRNLKRSGIAIKDLNTQAHINVINSLLSFLFFYIVYIVALITFLSCSLIDCFVDGLVLDIALSLCPSAHSIILILTNPKLKNVCIQVLKVRQRTS